MWKLNKKSGTTLIEALCALNILCIFFIISISIQLNNMTLKKYNNELISYIAVIEAVKGELSSNSSFEELIILHRNDKKFIKSDSLSLNSVKSININSLFSDIAPDKTPYLQMTIEEGEVLKIKLQLNYRFRDKNESIICEFYKGSYL
jgi:hypothetical protein